MTALTKEQQDYLEKRKEKMSELRGLVVEKYTHALFENISQIRTTILSLSVTSGAIAAFSLNLFKNDLIKNKPFLIWSFIIFLIVVWEGYFYLKFILERENNQLAKTSDDYNNSITEVRKAIEKVSREKSSENVTTLQAAEARLNETFNKEYKKTDNWFVKNIGNLMLIPFTVSLLLIILSFVDLSQLWNYLNILCVK